MANAGHPRAYVSTEWLTLNVLEPRNSWWYNLLYQYFWQNGTFMWIPIYYGRGQCLHLSLGQPAYVCLSIVLCGAYMLVCMFVCAHVCKVHVCCAPSACQHLLPLQRSVWMEHVLSALWSPAFIIPAIHDPPPPFLASELRHVSSVPHAYWRSR